MKRRFGLGLSLSVLISASLCVVAAILDNLVTKEEKPEEEKKEDHLDQE
ncbi:MAG: hypothetical protein IIZ27_09385 [Solobacterium sp.]|nr:hypothetical protein [Solobacterium sp.]